MNHSISNCTAAYPPLDIYSPSTYLPQTTASSAEFGFRAIPVALPILHSISGLKVSLLPSILFHTISTFVSNFFADRAGELALEEASGNEVDCSSIFKFEAKDFLPLIGVPSRIDLGIDAARAGLQSATSQGLLTEWHNRDITAVANSLKGTTQAELYVLEEYLAIIVEQNQVSTLKAATQSSLSAMRDSIKKNFDLFKYIMGLLGVNLPVEPVGADVEATRLALQQATVQNAQAAIQTIRSVLALEGQLEAGAAIQEDIQGIIDAARAAAGALPPAPPQEVDEGVQALYNAVKGLNAPAQRRLAAQWLAALAEANPVTAEMTAAADAPHGFAAVQDLFANNAAVQDLFANNVAGHDRSPKDGLLRLIYDGMSAQEQAVRDQLKFAQLQLQFNAFEPRIQKLADQNIAMFQSPPTFRGKVDPRVEMIKKAHAWKALKTERAKRGLASYNPTDNKVVEPKESFFRRFVWKKRTKIERVAQAVEWGMHAYRVNDFFDKETSTRQDLFKTCEATQD